MLRGSLLISGSGVRVPDGPPIKTGASRTPEAPADFRSAGLDLASTKSREICKPDRTAGERDLTPSRPISPQLFFAFNDQSRRLPRPPWQNPAKTVTGW